jgi:NADPH:quinone reductase-like Zn-dependent oxidoreductase
MFAVYAESFSSDDPLSGLVVGERPAPEAPDGWTTVTVKAASLNHHDLWSLRGVGLRQESLRRGRRRRGRQRGRRARRHRRPAVDR